MSPAENDTPMTALEELLIKHTGGTEFHGLERHRAKEHLVFSGDGHACVAWTLSAVHGEEPRTTRARIQGQSTFLGWHATGRQVEIPVISIARVGDPLSTTAEDWHHHWDRLGALAQIGVRAVGRPVLRADNALDLPQG